MNIRENFAGNRPVVLLAVEDADAFVAYEDPDASAEENAAAAELARSVFTLGKAQAAARAA